MEGSTRLLARLGDEHIDVIDAQRRILRDTWTGFGGTEPGTEGDSFSVVFPLAEQAVGAVEAGQRRLSGSAWPAGPSLRDLGWHRMKDLPQPEHSSSSTATASIKASHPLLSRVWVQGPTRRGDRTSWSSAAGRALPDMVGGHTVTPKVHS